MVEIARKISFGVGRYNEFPIDHHELFDDRAWSDEFLGSLKQKAKAQLGTVGSGNHYVDIFIDESQNVWIGVHFGSRGLGHAIATHYMKAGGGQDGMDVDPVLLDADSALGFRYIEAMTLAGDYAYAGRRWVVNRVLEIIGSKATKEIHNHHNFAWRENHFGHDLWVVRKGATPAFPGQYGFVGGSMGDDAVILKGVSSEVSAQALYSTVHGAGRVMSRTAAKGKFVRDDKGKKQRQQGLVRHDEMRKWLSRQGSLSDWRRFRRGTASVPEIEFSAGSARWNHRGYPPSETNWSCDGGKGHCRPLQRLVMGVLENQCLVLNRSWQAVNVITVQAALSMMAADAATGMNFTEGMLCSCQMERLAQSSGAARGRLHRHAQPQCSRAEGHHSGQIQQGASETSTADYATSTGTGWGPMRVHRTSAETRGMLNGACRSAVERRRDRMEKRCPSR